MNNQILPLLFAFACSCLTIACNQTSAVNETQRAKPSGDNQPIPHEYSQTADLKWLQNADPIADANAAIQKQDFNLLAFAGRVTSFPGIDSESNSLQQQCGYRLLANSGDVLSSEQQLTLRKKLYQYAAAYNQQIAVACEKSTVDD